MSYNGLWNHPISGQSTTLAQAQAQQQQQQQQTLRQATPNSFSAAGATIIAGQNEPVDHNIYTRAIAISEPRVVGSDGEHLQQQVRQKVVRRVEVPFTRQVKVPTQTTQLVPTTIEQKVPVRKLVEVQGYKTVQEPYTVFEEREAIRNKEIWVKKVVPERYIEKVAVQKIRTVQKPTTLIKEIQTYETVQVPTTKAIAVEGYRVDEVQDSKLVEVEETQDYETRLHPVGEPEINATRDLGRIPGAHLSRTVGQDVFASNHPQIQDVDQDSVVAPAGQLRGATYAEPLTTLGAQPPQAGGSYYSQNIRNSLSPSNQRTQPISPARTQSYGTTQPAEDVPPAGSFHKLAQAGDHSRDSLLASLKPLGLSVDDTHTRHTDGTGVLVTRVERGLPGARAGIQAFDIITSVANRPTSTVDELCQVLSRLNGPLQVTINRDGRRNIVVTLHK